MTEYSQIDRFSEMADSLEYVTADAAAEIRFPDATRKHRIRVWDAVVRSSHWMMAGGFAIAWLSAESERLQLVHIAAGSIVFAVALFRILWGIIGSRHARFSQFVRGPGAAWDYLKRLFSMRPSHTTGHNPAGGLAILALLALALLAPLSGWLTYQQVMDGLFSELHEGLASIMLFVIVIHLAGVFIGSLLHGENLVSAMVNGWKQGASDEGITRWHYPAAVVLVLWVLSVVVWTLQS